jgi:lysophospholipase L1-like esterase
VITLVAWGLFLYLASHRSGDPRILLYSPRYALLLAVVLIPVLLVTAANLDIGWRPLQTIRVPLILVTLSLLMSVVVLESAIRIIDPRGLSYYAEMTRHILDRVPDPELKFRNRPDFSSTYEGVEMKFNELGLRDDPVGPKPPGEYRILLLGDSQTLGWGVARDSTWAVRLQKILVQRTGRPIRVINAGVAGYDTRQEYRYLMRDGLKLEPDLVMLMYMDNDIQIDDKPYDPWSEERLEGKPPVEVLHLGIRKLRLYQLLWYWGRGLGRYNDGKSFDPRRAIGGIPWEMNPAVKQSFGWQQSMGHLKQMGDSLRAHGIGFAVVHFDYVAFPYSQAIDTAVKTAAAPSPETYSGDWFAGTDVRTFFLTPTDAHPNPAGTRIIADRVADFLLPVAGLVDPAQTPR